MAFESVIEIAAWCGAAAVVVAYHQCCSEKVSRLAKYRWQIAHMIGPIALLVMAASKHAWPAAALNLFWTAVAARALLKGPDAMWDDNGAQGHSQMDAQADGALAEESAQYGVELTEEAKAAASELAAMGVGEPPAAIESVIQSAPSAVSAEEPAGQGARWASSAEREAEMMARMAAQRVE